MDAGKIKINTLIISILIIAAVEIIVRPLINQNVVTPMFGLGLARLLEIILLLLLVKFNEKGFSTIGIASTRVHKGLKKGLIWAVIFGLAAGGILLILYLLRIHVAAFFRMPLPAHRRDLVAFFFIGAMIAPLAEELFFRGILYGFFRRWGISVAIIISTLLFVLSHAPGNTLPVTQLVGGILFAVSYEVEKNLLVPVTIHILGNLAIFTLAAIV